MKYHRLSGLNRNVLSHMLETGIKALAGLVFLRAVSEGCVPGSSPQHFSALPVFVSKFSLFRRTEILLNESPP